LQTGWCLARYSRLGIKTPWKFRDGVKSSVMATSASRDYRGIGMKSEYVQKIDNPL